MKTKPPYPAALALLLLLALATSSRAAVFYVRPDGNNANAGTGPAASQAWASIDYAINQGLAGGDIVYVMPGTYNERVIAIGVSAASTVYFRADTTGSIFGTSGTVTIQAPTATNSLEFSSSDNYRFENFVFSGAAGSVNARLTSSDNIEFINCAIVGGADNLSIVSSSGTVLRNVLMTASSDEGVVASTATNIEISNCTIVGSSDNAILVSNSNGVSMRNCVLANNGGRGLFVSLTTITHTHNLFHNNAGGDLLGTSADATEVFADPQFVGAGDYRLQETSPAIDAGVDLSSLVSGDFFGTVRPIGAGWDIGYHEYSTAITPNSKTILFVRQNSSFYTAQEQLRVDQFEDWGYTVTPITVSDSQASFNTAFAAADVAYVTEEILSDQVRDNLRESTIGVVSEEAFIDDSLGFTTLNGTATTSSTIQITDNTHPVTAGLPTGTVTITSSDQELITTLGSTAPGGEILAFAPSVPVLMVVEQGRELATTFNSSSLAFGRRVRLPWGGNNFDFAELNNSGLQLLQQALEWASSTGLLLHWKFDENSGTAAADSSGNGHEGTVNGSGTWVSALRGNAIEVDAAGHVEVDSLLGEPTSLTISCWVRLDAAGSQGAEAVSIGDYALMRLDSSGNSFFGFRALNAPFFGAVVSDEPLAGTGWRHLVGVFDDGANTVRTYLDGQLVSEETTSNVIDWSPGLGTATRVGGHVDGNAAFDLTGAIDDVRVYDYALNDIQVQELFGLRAHYRFDETSGSTAIDSSGQDNHGTHLNAPAVGIDAIRSKGVTYNSADSNDYTTLPNTLLDATSTVSIAWWMKTSNSGTAAVLSAANSSTPNELTLWFENSSTFRPFTLGTSNSYTITAYDDDRWHHYIYMVNASAGVEQLYIDGKLIVDATFPGVMVTLSVDSDGLLLGQDQDSVGGGFEASQALDGSLDDVRIYDRMLTEQEVAEIYGLVGHWKLDETGGTVAADSTAFDAHGTLQGSATWAEAGGQRGIDLDGFSSYVDLGRHDHLNFSGDITMSAWVRVRAATGDLANILASGRDVSLNRANFIRYVDDGSFFQAGSWAPNELVSFATNGDEVDTWVHLLALYDDGEWRFYKDGVLRSSATHPIGARELFEEGWAIGARSTGTERFFNGHVRDVRIYNRAVTPQEIAEIYGLVGWWRFEETSGNTAMDSSGMENHGFGDGLLAWSTNSREGSGSVQLDGTNSVEIPSTIISPGPASIAAWVNLTGAGIGGAEAVTVANALILRMHGQDTQQTRAIFRQGNSNFVNVPLGITYENAGWRHLAAVHDEEAMEVQLFVDGVLRLTQATTGPMVIDGGATVSRIGAHAGDGAQQNFTGLIDDVRVFNRPLTAEEVGDLFSSGLEPGVRIMRWVEMR